ncbi:MAG: HlyC/CorC family transporter [Nitrospinae bacterium]|nr:HlyC/CorC family transporter [Nitrospinota bacterium]
MDPALTLILIIFCLLSEGFFSGSELALISYNRIKMRHLAESGSRGASAVEALLKQPDKVFGATSMGTNISVFAASSIATVYFAERFAEADADFYSFIIMGPVTLILGEIVPKTLFRQRADFIAPYLAGPLSAAQKLFMPALFATSGVARLFAMVFLGGKSVPSALVSREEIISLTRMSEETLSLAHDEKKMIQKIFEFKTNTLESVMRPLVTVVGVPTVTTIGEVKARIAECGYSRLPVFHERIFNIVGVISAFDVLKHADHNMRVDKVMSPAVYAPLTMRNSSLLKEMQERNIHMAVVVDEYGGAIGITTLEDLAEEVVGEIEDEYDRPVKLYERVGDSEYLIDAHMEIDSINEELGLALPKGDYETLSGLINDALERIPRAGEKMAFHNHIITVEDSTPRGVKSARVEDLRPKPAQERNS